MSGIVTIKALAGAGTGDMERAVYDQNFNGIVDNSEMLGAQLPLYYDQNAHVADNALHLSPDERAAIDNSAFVPTGSNPFITNSSLNLKEDDLGNPATDGEILSSTIAGVRSWIPNVSGITVHNDLTGRSDIDTHPISAITNLQSALDLKAAELDLDNHLLDLANPHIVTATQVGLDQVDNTSDLAKPISTLTQSALDLKADESALTLHVNDTQVHLSTDERAAIDNSPSAPTALNSFATQADISAAGGGDMLKSTYDITDNGIVDNSEALGGNLPAYYAEASVVVAHVGDTANPHLVTAAQVGLGSADDTSDADKPVSLATQTALDLKEDDLGNPSTDGDMLTSTIAGVRSWVTPIPDNGAIWGNITGTLSNQIDLQLELTAKADQSAFISHTGDATIHFTEASIDHTAISNIGTNSHAAIDLHIADVLTNPHAVDAAAVGLGNVDNTSDANKPISTATQTALDLKASEADLTLHTTDTNIHLSVNERAAINSSPNTPTGANSFATQADIAASGGGDMLKATYDVLDSGVVDDSDRLGNQLPAFYATASDLTDHENDTANPHAVTPTQIGLDQIDNTSDANKPVSTATQTALDLKEDDLGLPISNGQVLSSNVGGTRSWVTVSGGGIPEAPTDSTLYGRINATWAEAATGAQGILADSALQNGDNVSELTNDAGYITIGSVITDHTGLTSIGTNTHDQIDTHVASTTNPHSVTASQIGLGAVDNTSDADKPVSTATQTALDLKEDDLGNPVSNGDHLVSTSAGLRSWATPPPAPSGFEANGSGYSIIGRVGANYGSPGTQAVDGSFSNEATGVNGATGQYSTAGGINVLVDGAFAAGFGNGILAPGVGMFAVGSYNLGLATNKFEVGIGVNPGTRQNGLAVQNDGLVFAPAATNPSIASATADVLITKGYADANYAGGGGAAWGGITGTLSDQTDLQLELDAKEDDLGTPASNGQVLQSTTGDVRTWGTLGSTAITNQSGIPGATVTAALEDIDNTMIQLNADSNSPFLLRTVDFTPAPGNNYVIDGTLNMDMDSGVANGTYYDIFINSGTLTFDWDDPAPSPLPTLIVGNMYRILRSPAGGSVWEMWDITTAAGVTVHNDLTGRSVADAHPQSAITNLVTDLAAKEDGLGNPATNGEALVSTTGGVRSWAPVATDNEFTFSQQKTPLTTTSTAFQTYHGLNITPGQTGSYAVQFAWHWEMPSANQAVEFRFVVDGVPYPLTYVIEPGDTGNTAMEFYQIVNPFTSGVGATIELQFRKDGGGTAVTVNEATIQTFKI